MAADRRKSKAPRRETGTAGQKTADETPRSDTLPPDPQTLGRPMTPDERVDEASLESMDGSDPPPYSASRSGAPRRAEDGTDEEAIRRRAYELWEADGRPHGRGDEYWHRAKEELSARTT